MNKIKNNILRSVFFILGLIGLLWIASMALMPKENEKNIGLIQPVLYSIIHEPKDSLDILVLGNSESHTSIIPFQIWEEYGYTTLNCASAGQPVSQSNTILNVAFNYQSPKIVIVETDMLFTHNSVYRAFLDQTQSFLPVFLYHNRWKSMYDEHTDTLSDYTDLTNTKNYKFSTVTAPADSSAYMMSTDDCESIPLVERFYLDCIKNCCEKHGTKLILVSTPSTVNWNMAKHNGIIQYANENNIDYIDMNILQDEIPINWETDTRDGGNHLNHAGAKKATAYLGRYLYQTGILKSHKDDPAFSSWNELLKDFKQYTGEEAD